MLQRQIIFTGDAVNDIRNKVADLMDRQRLSLRRAIVALNHDRGLRDLAERLGFGTNESEVA